MESPHNENQSPATSNNSLKEFPFRMKKKKWLRHAWGITYAKICGNLRTELIRSTNQPRSLFIATIWFSYANNNF